MGRHGYTFIAWILNSYIISKDNALEFGKSISIFGHILILVNNFIQIHFTMVVPAAAGLNITKVAISQGIEPEDQAKVLARFIHARGCVLFRVLGCALLLKEQPALPLFLFDFRKKRLTIKWTMPRLPVGDVG